MRLRAALLLLLAATLFSCARKEQPSVPAAKGDVVTGAYAYGNNVNTLRLCGTGEVLWVEAPPEVLAHLEREYAVKAKRAFEMVHVTARGRRESPPAEGPGAAYAGRFVISELIAMRPLTPGECGDQR